MARNHVVLCSSTTRHSPASCPQRSAASETNCTLHWQEAQVATEYDLHVRPRELLDQLNQARLVRHVNDIQEGSHHKLILVDVEFHPPAPSWNVELIRTAKKMPRRSSVLSTSSEPCIWTRLASTPDCHAYNGALGSSGRRNNSNRSSLAISSVWPFRHPIQNMKQQAPGVRQQPYILVFNQMHSNSWSRSLMLIGSPQFPILVVSLPRKRTFRTCLFASSGSNCSQIPRCFLTWYHGS